MTAEGDAARGAAERVFADLVAAFADQPGVSHGGDDASRDRFGADALKVAGKIFMMRVGGEIVVKLPRARVEGLVEAGAGVPFAAGGRVMREWVALPPGPGCEHVAAEALAFVGGRP